MNSLLVSPSSPLSPVFHPTTKHLFVLPPLLSRSFHPIKIVQIPTTSALENEASCPSSATSFVGHQGSAQQCPFIRSLSLGRVERRYFCFFEALPASSSSAMRFLSAAFSDLAARSFSSADGCGVWDGGHEVLLDGWLSSDRWL